MGPLHLSRRWQIGELPVPLAVFFILIWYTYGILFVSPYPGFAYNNSNGQIVEIYSQQTPSLQVGDILVQVGPISWKDYKKDSRLVFFEGVQPGEIVEITVTRNGTDTTIPWKFAGFDHEVFKTRFFNIWWLAFIFWICGTVVQVLMRPKDGRRRLFIAANYLTALWLIFGTLSHSHLWESSILLHAVTWLLLPVYLHFHWAFPRPLKELSKTTWGVIYLAGFVFAAAELLQLLPKNLYVFAFLIALLGSIILEGSHYKQQADRRRDVITLAIAIAVAFVPSMGLGVLIINREVPYLGPAALFALPIMPLVYFYVIYRRQLGGLEVRLNRFISLYAFLILFGTALLLLVGPIMNLEMSAETAIIIGVLVVVAAMYLAITIFPIFQTFVEKRFLGVRLPYQNLQGTYSSRIAACTSINDLLQLLEDEVFPSLFVRQFAFVHVDEGGMGTLLAKNVPAESMPIEDGISQLVERSGKYIPGFSPADGWIRLILPLKAGDSFIGFWLLGQRDPDDLYPQAEIPILQSIANQTAIALSNILQSERVRKLYEANVERNDQERNRLARDLHDVVLHQLATLRNNLGLDVPPAFQANYDEVVSRLREIVSDLRPPMLMYGLKPAIEGLADNLMERSKDTIAIVVDLRADGEVRYAESIEQHLYRIVQEACENSLRHADAKSIAIHGTLTSEKVELNIHDDGKGFDTGSKLDTLVAGRHFGLSNMVERAALIGAEIKFHSIPNTGIRIQLAWGSEKIM